MVAVDIAAGKRFGMWTVLDGDKGRSAGTKKRITIPCICDCGSERMVIKENLVRGGSTNCGCVRGDVTSRKNRKRTPRLAAAHYHYYSYVINSRTRGNEIGINEKRFHEIASFRCHYCGSEPKEHTIKVRGSRVGSGYFANGLDRIDSNMGYEINNVVPCCFVCNRMKSNFSYEDFIKSCHSISRMHPEIKDI